MMVSATRENGGQVKTIEIKRRTPEEQSAWMEGFNYGLKLRDGKVSTKTAPAGYWRGPFCSACGSEAITEWNDTGGEYVFSEYCPKCGTRMYFKTKE